MIMMIKVKFKMIINSKNFQNQKKIQKADNQTNILTEKSHINNPKTKIIEILILIEEF